MQNSASYDVRALDLVGPRPMIGAFLYNSPPTRIRFGAGTIDAVAEEAASAGIARALVLSTPEQEPLGARVAALLGERAAGRFAGATMHTPVDVTDGALLRAKELAIDGIVAVGGGSTIGLGKAIAVRTGLPQIVLPTTYAGSEMTPILGETEGGRKTTRRDPRIQPGVVVYDVDLTIGLPVAFSVTSGLNAIAHAVEALYAVDANPITSLMAEEGIRALTAALPAIRADARDVPARSEALYGAWLCGACLGQTSMALHHKLCHTLGGSFGLPHAEVHSVVLPHALAYNAAAAPAAMARIARAMATTEPPAKALHRLAAELGAPMSLGALGLDEEDVGRAAEIAASQPYPNPRPIERAGIQALLRRAWAGDMPLT